MLWRQRICRRSVCLQSERNKLRWTTPGTARDVTVINVSVGGWRDLREHLDHTNNGDTFKHGLVRHTSRYRGLVCHRIDEIVGDRCAIDGKEKTQPRTDDLSS